MFPNPIPYGGHIPREENWSWQNAWAFGNFNFLILNFAEKLRLFHEQVRNSAGFVGRGSENEKII